MEPLHVIVVGCGRVGSELASRLSAQGHETTIVDRDRRAFRRLPPNWKGKSVLGYGFDRDTLEEAGITYAKALAAVTSGDNTNILTARIARETYFIKDVVARIYDPRRAVIYQKLGISTVATVTWTTEQAVRRLFPGKSYAEWTDPSGEVSLMEVLIPPSLCGKKLSQIEQPGLLKPVSLRRSTKVSIVGPDTVGQDGDVLYLAIASSYIEKFESILAEGKSTK